MAAAFVPVCSFGSARADTGHRPMLQRVQPDQSMATGVNRLPAAGYGLAQQRRSNRRMHHAMRQPNSENIRRQHLQLQCQRRRYAVCRRLVDHDLQHAERPG